MQDRPLIGVAVIVIKDDKILLGKRKNSHGAGTWALPGGHLEFGESIKDCARRELWEEAGIRIRNLRYGPYTNDVFKRQGKHYVTLFVLADYDSGAPTVKEPLKCEQWQWHRWPPEVKPHFLPLANLMKQNFKLPD
jgi:8-oxo-dGTP diphosphatase